MKIIFISQDGDDSNEGTLNSPLKTIEKGLYMVKQYAAQGHKDIRICLRQGVYRLDKTIKIDNTYCHEDITLKIASYDNEQAVICGSRELGLYFEKFNDGVYVSDIEEALEFDTLFVNGTKYIMARYPNFDENIDIFNGYAEDSLSRERVSSWKNPRGGYIHAMHKHLWGGYHYMINGKDEDGNLLYEGGWQNNRQLGMHSQYRYVENIFEELDAPGEWYFDPAAKKLYIYPYDTHDLNNSKVELVTLSHLVEILGAPDGKVCNVEFENITFKHTKRTFMETKEPLLRSDWTIYRGGAVLMENTNDCSIKGCSFMDLGGNAIFVSGDNTNATIKSCLIKDIGANGIAFVGSNDSVRNPLFEYGERQSIKEIDMAPGPKSNNYPKDSLVYDCLIFNTGTVEKQSAPIEISMSKNITISHCSIYDVPRAGINISEGTFGGHIIEYCDVFDTVKETGDHGSFNSWGRDRYWGLNDIDLNKLSELGMEQLPFLDAAEKTIIRNNRFRCDRGWDIDLDDGSSRYEIYNNLCLNGGIKLREGFSRVCKNNITVNNSVHVHVWYENSHDVIENNIVFEPYKPIGMPGIWGESCDFNILHLNGLKSTEISRRLQAVSNMDQNSINADCKFTNPSTGDYTVNNESVLNNRFENFKMGEFGVVSPGLVSLAKTPELPVVHTESVLCDGSLQYFEIDDLVLKNIDTEGEMSAYGTAEKNGVIVVSIAPFNSLFLKGLKSNDVIIKINGCDINSVQDFEDIIKRIEDMGKIELVVLRNQITTVIK